MRWHNERIVKAIKQRMVGDFIHVEPAAELMRIMRDDYEAALIAQRAEAVKLAQRVAELEAAHDARGQGAFALAEKRGHTIAQLVDEKAALRRQLEDGRIYAEGCAP